MTLRCIRQKGGTIAERQLNMKKMRVLQLCQLALLISIEFVMSFTPLGFLNLGFLSASLLTIPVAVGAIILGPAESTILGLVFGLISFYKGFSSASAMTAAMYAASIPGSFITAVVGRVLMGFGCGWIVQLIRKLAVGNHFADCVAGGLAAPLLNTAFYMGFLMLIFYHTAYIQNLIRTLGISNPVLLIGAMVGVQALIEAVTCCIIASAVGRALKAALRVSH